MHNADWYYDFISPYSYFGLLRLEELTHQVKINYHPVLFAELLKHWGQKGPAEVSSKRAWTYRWCAWWATQQGIPFRFPAVHPFNPLPYLRLAIAANNSSEAVKLIYQTLWTTGADPTDDEVLAKLVRSLGIDRSRLADQDVKDTLRQETQAALEREVFGVPTLVMNGELFWGADATDFAKAYIADPSIIATDEMRRVASLPVGASRKSN
jgi:2-hydroxychromene-2-carboxylate isomerase